MTCLVLPNLGYPDGVFILRVSGDDVAQATRQVLRALLQQSEQRVALPRFAGHFADQAVHLKDSLPYDINSDRTGRRHSARNGRTGVAVRHLQVMPDPPIADRAAVASSSAACAEKPASTSGPPITTVEEGN